MTTDSAGLWHLFRDGWHGAGWGTNLESSPAVAVLAGLTWLGERIPAVAEGRSPAAVIAAWFLVAALPTATLTAYLASRVLPVSRWIRAVVALAWGCSGVALAAVAHGRVTAALSQILLPLIVAGIVRVARADRRQHRQGPGVLRGPGPHRHGSEHHRVWHDSRRELRERVLAVSRRGFQFIEVVR